MIDARREAAPALVGIVPDPTQARAMAHRGPLLRILGGPGTGKTTLALEIVADRVARGELSAEQVLLLSATRRGAANLRSRVTTRLGSTTREPLARTFSSFGFGILRRAAVADDRPTPRLLTGAEQDAILKELLAGHRANPHRAPAWPEPLLGALATRGFRDELRDLLMRAVEHGLDAVDLAELGVRHNRPEWVAGAAVLDEYDQVTALSRPGAYDPAWILTAAADALEWDPAALDALVSEIRLIVIDDTQEVTTPGARLVRLLARGGIPLVLLGDPDAAVQGFRGADPTFIASTWADCGPGETVVLGTGHRVPAEIHAYAARAVGVVAALGGARQRVVAPSRAGGALEVHVFRSGAQEAAYVADVLRRAHLLDGLAWSDMAVLVRGRARAQTVRRVLEAANVPTSDAEAGLALRDESAVRAVMTVYEIALRSHSGGASEVGVSEAGASEVGVSEVDVVEAGADPVEAGADPVEVAMVGPTSEEAIDLLTSPFGEADAVTVRRLRRTLRRRALDDGLAAPADRLIADALTNPGRLVGIGPHGGGARRIARMLGAATGALRDPAVNAQEVLWAIWAAADVAAAWRANALGGGRIGLRCDRHLDAMVALFAAAETFADEFPGHGPAPFLDHVLGQDVAVDSIVPRSPDNDAVALVTPHAAAGRQWRLVAVVGVQEGSWPNLRPRGSLLGSEALVDGLKGRDSAPRAALSALRHDEARLFYVGLTRATDRVLVSAVRSDDEQASPFLDLIEGPPSDGLGGAVRAFTEVGDPMTLVGVVGRHRRALVEDPTRGDDAAVLATLAEAGVRGADPSSWWAMRAVSDSRPRRDPAAPVRVSPSSLGTFGECQLRWFLQASGGEGPSIGSAAVGTLIHEVLAECGDADLATLDATLTTKWARLGLPTGWIDRRKRAESGDMLMQAEAYAHHARAEGWDRVGAEVPMEVRVGRATVAGTVDRLERHPNGTVRVVDYKTGSRKPTKAEVETVPQLGAYQLAVTGGSFADVGTASGGAALVQLGKAGTGPPTKVAQRVQIQRPLDEAQDPLWATDVVADAAEAMGGAHFVARYDTDRCRVCPVTACCPIHPNGVMLT